MAQWTPDLPPRRPPHNHRIRRTWPINLPRNIVKNHKTERKPPDQFGKGMQEWRADPVNAGSY